MAEEQSMVSDFRKWFIENKLKAVGFLWAGSVAGSLAYNFSNPNMKTSVKVIHARLHAQALTLAALAASAAVEYYDHQSGEKAKRYEKHIQSGWLSVVRVASGQRCRADVLKLYGKVRTGPDINYIDMNDRGFLEPLRYQLGTGRNFFDDYTRL